MAETTDGLPQESQAPMPYLTQAQMQVQALDQVEDISACGGDPGDLENPGSI